jgi:hypothetical protein
MARKPRVIPEEEYDPSNSLAGEKTDAPTGRKTG